MNPNVYNGYKNEFGGMFNVGIVVNVPLFHFGDKCHTLNAAKSQRKIAGMQLDEVKEKMQLQIKQNSYKVAESMKEKVGYRKKYRTGRRKFALCHGRFSMRVCASTDLLGAQTAWLSAKSENIDACIDLKLCNLYLSKSLGTLK